MRQLMHGAPPCPSLWQMLWQVVGVSASEATELWRILHLSRDPHCVAWRYSLQRYMDVFASGEATEMTPYQFLAGPWSGKVVIDALERLAIDHLIERRTASRYEEVFLEQMNRYGGWRFMRRTPSSRQK